MKDDKVFVLVHKVVYRRMCVSKCCNDSMQSVSQLLEEAVREASQLGSFPHHLAPLNLPPPLPTVLQPGLGLQKILN